MDQCSSYRSFWHLALGVAIVALVATGCSGSNEIEPGARQFAAKAEGEGTSAAADVSDKGGEEEPDDKPEDPDELCWGYAPDFFSQNEPLYPGLNTFGWFDQFSSHGCYFSALMNANLLAINGLTTKKKKGIARGTRLCTGARTDENGNPHTNPHTTGTNPKKKKGKDMHECKENADRRYANKKVKVKTSTWCRNQPGFLAGPCQELIDAIAAGGSGVIGTGNLLGGHASTVSGAQITGTPPECVLTVADPGDQQACRNGTRQANGLCTRTINLNDNGRITGGTPASSSIGSYGTLSRASAVVTVTPQ